MTRNQKGMQGGEALTGDEGKKALEVWLKGRDRAVETAQELADLEVHKQYANRVLEPYAHISVIVTSSTFSNWFALRVSKMAQPEIQHLAVLMYEAYQLGTPDEVKDGR
ncbi:MAG: FAD-dependent thymidylate synthase [Calothrix sp. SM1_5_4]|nr:FAD-dependent thymidylate synthase [Calothrix sp. SM1_5_4]